VLTEGRIAIEEAVASITFGHRVVLKEKREFTVPVKSENELWWRVAMGV
jgi:hypothetical protein